MNEDSQYLRLGGAEGLRRLVDRFYDIMDSEAGAAGIRAMHASNLDSARTKLHMFLSGFLGGPQLYVEKFGHPRLRRRHMPFAIDEQAAREWMHCMNRALDEHVADPLLRAQLSGSFDQVAQHLRNDIEPTKPRGGGRGGMRRSRG